MLIGFGPRRQVGPETGDSVVPQSDRVAFVRDGDVYAGGAASWLLNQTVPCNMLESFPVRVSSV